MPAKLYKYRAFNVPALRWISEAEVYYSSPRSFNDPLDCDPTVEVDVSTDDMQRLYMHLLKSKHGSSKARAIIGDIRFEATEEEDWPTALRLSLASRLKNWVDSELGSVGVLSLSATWSSALMWSHYADEHKGICIEYDTRDQPHDKLKAVSYNSPRAIAVSDLIKWKMKSDDQAQRRVCDTFFYAKSREWRYEKEWRDIADFPGVDESPFRMTAIHFGMRCDPAVITSVVKLLNQDRNVKLWGIQPKEDSFELKRVRVSCDEIESNGIREPTFLAFQDIIWDKDDELWSLGEDGEIGDA